MSAKLLLEFLVLLTTVRLTSPLLKEVEESLARKRKGRDREEEKRKPKMRSRERENEELGNPIDALLLTESERNKQANFICSKGERDLVESVCVMSEESGIDLHARSGWYCAREESCLEIGIE